jgi:hypothetical protein
MSGRRHWPSAPAPGCCHFRKGIARIEHDLTKYRILQVTPELRQAVVRHSKQQHRAELDQRSFLADLEKMKKQAVSYFKIYRTALGSGSPALAERARVDKRVTGSDLYQVARDIATRAGIEQGLILAPQHERERANASADASMISATRTGACCPSARGGADSVY